MADFRQRAPEVTPNLINPGEERRRQAVPSPLSGIADAVGAGLNMISNDVKLQKEAEENRIASEFIRGVADQSPIFDEQEVEAMSEMREVARRLEQRDRQRGPEQSSEIDMLVYTRKFMNKYPGMEPQVAEMFKNLSGMGFLQAISEAEDQLMEPARNERKWYEEQAEKFSIKPDTEGWRQRVERRVADQNALIASQQRVDRMKAEGELTTRNAEFELIEQMPGILNTLQASLTRDMATVDPATLSADERERMIQERRETVANVRLRLQQQFDGKLSDERFNEIASEALYLEERIESWLRGDIQLESLENANNMLQQAHDLGLRQTPGYMRMMAAAEALRGLPDFAITRTQSAAVGQEFLGNYVSIFRMGENGEGNALRQMQEEGQPESYIRAQFDHMGQVLKTWANNKSMDPDIRAEFTMDMLRSYTAEIRENAESIPTTVYESLLNTLADPEVFQLIEQVHDDDVHTAMVAATHRYMRDILEDGMARVVQTQDPNGPWYRRSLSELFGTSEFQEGDVELRADDQGVITAHIKDVTGSDRQSSILPSYRAQLRSAVNDFNKRYSKRLGFVARAQAHTFRSKDYKKQAEYLIKVGALAAPEPGADVTATERELARDLVARYPHISEDRALEFVMQSTRSE